MLQYHYQLAWKQLQSIGNLYRGETQWNLDYSYCNFGCFPYLRWESFHHWDPSSVLGTSNLNNKLYTPNPESQLNYWILNPKTWWFYQTKGSIIVLVYPANKHPLHHHHDLQSKLTFLIKDHKQKFLVRMFLYTNDSYHHANWHTMVDALNS